MCTVNHKNKTATMSCLICNKTFEKESDLKRHRAIHTSQYRGVTKYGKKWKATFEYKGLIYLASIFDTEEKAAEAYDKVAFAKLNYLADVNFPERIEGPLIFGEDYNRLYR